MSSRTAEQVPVGMTPTAFIAKWRHVDLSERSSAQTHFNDLCRLVGHPDPIAADPQGQWFTFERGATKATGGEGWADVWKREFFGWEYKGRHKDLGAAYLQLLRYQGALENPPLLVTCDTDRIVVHTHFANTPAQTIELTLEGLVEPEQLAVLRDVFHSPERLRPGQTIQVITEEAARKVTDIARALRGRGLAPDRVARFLDGVVFCLFAEDIGLLPNKVFTRVVQNTQGKPALFRKLAAELFDQMAFGGNFGAERIEHFNGNLFKGGEALDITAEELRDLLGVTGLDWSSIDASIFGTLFERALDPDQRTQFGAHYTSREDIETLVDPVVMMPLRREWADAREHFDRLVAGKPTARQLDEARGVIRNFLGRVASVTVLDPACGSGNFLYVTLQKLKDLEKEVIIHASSYVSFFPQVGPWQLRGIESNAYAHHLAQMTVWIGHLQWHNRHGMPLDERPILRPMTNFEHKDALIDEASNTEPGWPAAEYIVGNPPFLGDKFMRGYLGESYVHALRALYAGRVPAAADLCCYWFEKARARIAAGMCKRAGLLATQGIRGGANRNVLERIKESGQIFFAISDREWVLEGANVHVSLIAFDGGEEREIVLDGERVTSIHADLTSRADTTRARSLPVQVAECFQGPVRVGDFDVSEAEAIEFLSSPNPHGYPNSDVLRPTLNGNDNLKQSRRRWVVDFVKLPLSEASLYQGPFRYVEKHVKPARSTNAREGRRLRWWQHGETGDAMREAFAGHSRFLAVAQTAKYLVFRWHSSYVSPEQTMIVFARDDDYFFGVMQSYLHRLWSLATGTQLETRPRYTPTTCFSTFPFPSPTQHQRKTIAAAARELDRLRSAWMSPPEWIREEALEFPARIDGAWAELIVKTGKNGIGTARYTRQLPVDAKAEQALARRTMTNLYNERPTWLDNAHRALDEAVFAAYGWEVSISDEILLARLLELNVAGQTSTSAAPVRAAEQLTTPAQRPVMAKADIRVRAKRRRRAS